MTLLVLTGPEVLRAQNAPPQVSVDSRAQIVPVQSLVDAPDPAPDAPSPDVRNAAGSITGTVTDTNGDLVPGATVAVEPAKGGSRMTQVANDNGYFTVAGLAPNVSYRVTVSAPGFDPYVAGPVTLTPGQFFEVTGIKLKVEDAVTSITVTASTPLEMATEQVQIEEKQRILGFVPNFYVVYDAANAAPLTTKLKFQMAYKVAIDPVNIFGAAFIATMNQAGDRPNFPQGWGGYGQRFGAAYADGVTDIMFGGAILPSLLHQDPRYFYQGTGSTKSRVRHALSNPFVARADDGHLEPNYSSLGGDLISNALSNTYYPKSNRGAAFTFEGFAIATGTREVSSLLQEFVLRKLTPGAKHTEE